MPAMQFPPYALVMFVSSAISGGLGLYGLTKRENRAFIYFGAAFLLAASWPLLYGIQLIFADREIISRVAQLAPVPIQFFPITLLSFIHLLLKKDMPPKWLTAIMLVFAVASAASMATNDRFHLAWDMERSIVTPEGFNLILLIPSVWLRFLVSTYHFGSDILILAILYKGILTYKQPYRAQFQLMMLSLLVTVVITVLFTFQLVSFGSYNPVPAALAMSSVIMAIAIFRYQLLTVIPYARESVFDAIDSPAVITDKSDTLLEFNNSAKKVLRLTSGDIGGKTAQVFSRINMDWSRLKENESVQIETRWGTGQNRIFSALKKRVHNGDLHGFIVVFTDITDQMLLMQTEHEKEIVTYKESLLGDMHDGIGGVVATAAIVAQSALEEDDVSAKNRKIEQIASLLENGSFELRSMLNILDKESIDWSSLVADMRAFSSTVLDSKCIARKFRADGEPYTHDINFDRYLSIFRLFKEIITNIIKHSGADSVEIQITFGEEFFKMCVSDNGVGITDAESKGYGLKNMQRRTEKLGGNLAITSENGTTVSIDIPVL